MPRQSNHSMVKKTEIAIYEKTSAAGLLFKSIFPYFLFLPLIFTPLTPSLFHSPISHSPSFPLSVIFLLFPFVILFSEFNSLSLFNFLINTFSFSYFPSAVPLFPPLIPIPHIFLTTSNPS